MKPCVETHGMQVKIILKFYDNNTNFFSNTIFIFKHNSY